MPLQGDAGLLQLRSETSGESSGKCCSGAAGEGVSAKVVVVEPTGAETELLVQVGESKLVVVLHGRTDVQPDDIVGLLIKTDKVHLFDGATEKRI